jgi:hypothetical protein
VAKLLLKRVLKIVDLEFIEIAMMNFGIIITLIYVESDNGIRNSCLTQSLRQRHMSNIRLAKNRHRLLILVLRGTEHTSLLIQRNKLLGHLCKNK